MNLARISQVWPAVIEHVRDSGAEMLSTLFEGARPLSVDNDKGVVKVGFPSSAKFNKRKAEAPANTEIVAESIKAIAGERLRPVYELMDVDDVPPESEVPAAEPMTEEEKIDLIKAKFDASEVAVSEDPPRGEETG